MMSLTLKKFEGLKNRKIEKYELKHCTLMKHAFAFMHNIHALMDLIPLNVKYLPK